MRRPAPGLRAGWLAEALARLAGAGRGPPAARLSIAPGWPDLAEAPFPEDPLLVWIDGESTRGVLLHRERDELVLRVPTLGTAADLALMEALAGELPGPPLEPLGPGWRAARQQADLQELEQVLASGRTVGLGGLHRVALLGPRVVAELRADGRFHPEGVQAVLRAVHHLAPGTVAPPAEPVDPRAPRPLGLVARLGPGRPTLVASGPLVRIWADPPLTVPRAALEAALGERARRIDEEHLLVPALEAGPWLRLVERLRAHHVADPAAWARAQDPSPRPEGALVPLLRHPADLPGPGADQRHPLVGGLGPVVTYVIDAEDAVITIPTGGFDPETATLARSRAAALAALRRWEAPVRPLRWPDGREDGLEIRGDHAAALLLDGERLRGLQAQLGAAQLWAAAPARDELLILDAWAEPAVPRAAALLARVEARFAARRGDRFRVGPEVWLVDEGQICGQLSPRGVVDRRPAPVPDDPPEPGPSAAAGPTAGAGEPRRPDPPDPASPPGSGSSRVTPRVGPGSWVLVPLIGLILIGILQIGLALSGG